MDRINAIEFVLSDRIGNRFRQLSVWPTLRIELPQWSSTCIHGTGTDTARPIYELRRQIAAGWLVYYLGEAVPTPRPTRSR